jgi:FKBP-type peptidyl-prolyl cis-trans isomerase
MTDAAAPSSDAVHCISGLVYQVLRPARGDDRPGPDDIVRVLLEACDEAARSVDSSAESGAARVFVVKNAAPGLAEAFQLMGIGQKMRVWFPADPARRQEETMSFEVEMVDFTRVAEKPPLPHELTSPRRNP